MIHINATKAKNHFGAVLDTAQRDPVLIDKNGRSVAVVLSNQEYTRLQAIEEGYWALKAEVAKKQGFLSPKESDALLENLLNA